MTHQDPRVVMGELLIAGIGVVALVIAWLIVRRTYPKGSIVSAKDKDVISQTRIAWLFVAWFLADLWSRYNGLSYHMFIIVYRSALVALFLGIMGRGREGLFASLRSSSWWGRLVIVLIVVLSTALCAD